MAALGLRPRPRRAAWFKAALAIAAIPAALWLILLATATLAPLPALAGLALSVIAALFLGRIAVAELAALAAQLQAAYSGIAAPPPRGWLPGIAEAAEAAAELAYRIATAEALLERLRRADAAIIEALPDPLLVLSAEREILRSNRAAQEMLGPPTGPANVPADAPALLRHPALAEALDRAIASGAVATAELSLPVPVARDILARAIPLDPLLADGGQVLLLLADRTPERAFARMRTDFVANASHELRTPLAAIIGFIETLRGPAAADPAAQQRFLAIMAEQADRMRRLIDDLLSLSRIESMEHEAPKETADLAAIARGEAEALAPLLATRGARLTLEVPAAAPIFPADPPQVAQVVRNLLDNAIRYGRERGEIRLSVVAAAGPDGRPGRLLTVADDGPGVPREHIPRLTERFYRVDKGRSRRAGGTGLGLAIVKHIVNRHRGSLRIDSEEGVGTTVSVWWPAER